MSAADGRPVVGRPVREIVWVDANGTMWRLRSLVAMGHGARRLADALGVGLGTVQTLLGGEAALICTELRDLAHDLWEAWWDKRPPETTRAERQLAAEARRRAERHKWCQPGALDEDALDEPGYRPYSIFRPAAGLGVAGEFHSTAEWPAGDEKLLRELP
jgi:hypothetical protein